MQWRRCLGMGTHLENCARPNCAQCEGSPVSTPLSTAQRWRVLTGIECFNDMCKMEERNRSLRWRHSPVRAPNTHILHPRMTMHHLSISMPNARADGGPAEAPLGRVPLERGSEKIRQLLQGQRKLSSMMLTNGAYMNEAPRGLPRRRVHGLH